MGKRLLAIMMTVLLAGIVSAQDAAMPPAPPSDPLAVPEAVPAAVEPAAAAPAPTASAPAGDASADVRAELDRERQRRERQKQELKEQQRELTDQLSQVEAKMKQAVQEIPDAQKALETAEKKEAMCYAKLTSTGTDYASAEQIEREAFKNKILGELNAKFKQEYDTQLANHRKDMAFIEDNKWRREDLIGLRLAMDAEDPSRVLQFSKSGDDRVNGVFPTHDYASGKAIWHQVPSDAAFSVIIHSDNPFVADVSIHPGVDLMGINATNVLDWDVHVYIAKQWKSKGGGFSLSGVAWPADINRKMSRQISEPPTFVPTAMPVLQVATVETPEIKTALDAWKFSNPGWIQKLQDTQSELKVAKNEVKVTRNRIPRIEIRVKRKMEELAEEKKGFEKEIADVEILLREYEDPVEEGEDVDLEDAGGGAAAGGESLGNDF